VQISRYTQKNRYTFNRCDDVAFEAAVSSLISSVHDNRIHILGDVHTSCPDRNRTCTCNSGDYNDPNPEYPSQEMSMSREWKMKRID